MNILILYFAKD